MPTVYSIQQGDQRTGGVWAESYIYLNVLCIVTNDPSSFDMLGVEGDMFGTVCVCDM